MLVATKKEYPSGPYEPTKGKTSLGFEYLFTSWDQDMINGKIKYTIKFSLGSHEKEVSGKITGFDNPFG